MTGFGEWVRSELVSLARSDSWLCQKTGLSHTTVTRYRVLGQQPRTDAFVAICEVLSSETGVDLDKVIISAMKSTRYYRNAKSRLGS